MYKWLEEESMKDFNMKWCLYMILMSNESLGNFVMGFRKLGSIRQEKKILHSYDILSLNIRNEKWVDDQCFLSGYYGENIGKILHGETRRQLLSEIVDL